MREYVTEISKYALPVLMGLYALCGFCSLTDRLEKKGFLYVLQNLFLFTSQLLMFLDLALVSSNVDYAFLYLFMQVFLVGLVLVVPLLYENANKLLLNNMGMLLGVGICVISRISFQKAVKQYVIVLISLLISLFIPWLMLQIRFLKKLTWVYGLAGLILLGSVFVLGDETLGSMLTIELWKVSFQPSEFVKLIFVFFLAGALWDKASLGRVAGTAAVAGAYVLMLVTAKDLGSALIFFVGYVLVVSAAARNWLYLLAGAAGGSGAAYVAYRIFPHVRTRVLAWRDPWSYIDFQGYAITQSLFAIGSGNWLGMGLLKGNPGTIPYVEEDFTFSAVCEELGVAFAIGMLLVILVSFFFMMKMALRIRDRFYQTVVYGIGIMYIFQTFLTVGGGIRLIPLTGVTLPLVSYGGSSVMVTMIMFFIVEGIYMRLQQEGERRNVRVAGQKKPHTEGRSRTEGWGGGRAGHRDDKSDFESGRKGIGGYEGPSDTDGKDFGPDREAFGGHGNVQDPHGRESGPERAGEAALSGNRVRGTVPRDQSGDRYRDGDRYRNKDRDGYRDGDGYRNKDRDEYRNGYRGGDKIAGTQGRNGSEASEGMGASENSPPKVRRRQAGQTERAGRENRRP